MVADLSADLETLGCKLFFSVYATRIIVREDFALWASYSQIAASRQQLGSVPDHLLTRSTGRRMDASSLCTRCHFTPPAV